MTDRHCRFCGRKYNLYPLEEQGTDVCGACWDVIVEIVKRYLSANEIIKELEGASPSIKLNIPNAEGNHEKRSNLR
jgi:hypothetical protein